MSRRSRSIGGFTLRNGVFLPSLVRSVQRGTITIGAASTSNTATITAVVLANSRLRLLGYSNDGNVVTITEDNCLLAFTNSTTITASHQTAGNTIVASFEVIEYWPGIIRSVQRGTIALTGVASNTATITSVNISKTELDLLGFTFTGTLSVDHRARLDLTNATTITATRVGNTNDMVVGYQAVQQW